jgi:pimeloyl-ACP methyl ester carboxylesterase
MPVFDSGGIEIYYKIQGQGEPLLLIHGLGSSSRDWEMQDRDFSRHFRVIKVDLRGHGRSGKPPGPYKMQAFAGDVAGLLVAQKAYPAYVLGISLGGMVAFQLVLDHPNLVKKLVIVNSVPELVPRGFRDRVGYWQRLAIIHLLGMKKMGQFLADRFFTEPDQEPLKKIFVSRWAENHKPSYLAALKAAYGWSVRDRLSEIRVPTLVVGADGDYFSTADKEAYTALIPGARLAVIENSKHALPAERPEEFNRLVVDFLQHGLSE